MRLVQLHESGSPSPLDLMHGDEAPTAFIYDHTGHLEHAKSISHFTLIRKNVNHYRSILDPDIVQLAAEKRSFLPGDDDNRAAAGIRWLISPKDTPDLPNDGHRWAVGRVGMAGGQRIVAFWHQSPLLRDCVAALIDDGVLDGTEVIAGTPGPQTANEFAGIVDEGEDDEEADRLRQLHLMPPDEKKVALRKLGVGHPGHRTAARMASAGRLAPGQKLWAPHSEGRMKLSELHEGMGQGKKKVWDAEEEQGASRPKRWYQRYERKAKQYRWPRTTGPKPEGYEEHILK